MMRSILLFSLPLLALACDKPAETKPQPAATTTATTEAKGATPEVKPAATANAAAAYPATALPAKNVADYTIGVPPGAKLEKVSDDKASLETPDYKVMISIAKANETAKMKELFSKAPGYRAIVDDPNGLVMETDEKGKKSIAMTRYVTVGDKVLGCDSALTKPPSSEAKAKEAWDVCGTLKKK